MFLNHYLQIVKESGPAHYWPFLFFPYSVDCKIEFGRSLYQRVIFYGPPENRTHSKFPNIFVITKKYLFLHHVIYYDAVVNMLMWPYHRLTTLSVVLTSINETMFLCINFISFMKLVQRNHKTIVVTEQTYETLKHMGTVTESFNDVILKLIENTATSQSSLQGHTGRAAVVLDRYDPEAVTGK
jgi:Putative antitoxin